MYQRIMIFGRPGSGKSTFALKLNKKTNLPLHYLDKHFFLENWVERDYQEFLRIQKDIVDNECWIVDGNSTRSLELRYAHADICLYFNYPKLVCLWRILKRIYMCDNRSRPKGCKDRFSWRLIKYMWNFEKRVDRNIAYLRKKYPAVVFVEVNNNNDLVKAERILTLRQGSEFTRGKI